MTLKKANYMQLSAGSAVLNLNEPDAQNVLSTAIILFLIQTNKPILMKCPNIREHSLPIKLQCH